MNIFVRNIAFALGYILTPQVQRRQVLQLIRSLRPQDCGKRLIRVGARGDGGYLIPDDLGSIQYCFSPGVSTVVDFEIQLAARNIQSFLADYSVDGPPTPLPQLVFDKKFIGTSDNDTCMTLASWKQRYLPQYRGDLLLQMDIEGAEYAVILSTPEELLRSFRIIVLELHHLERLFEPFAHAIMKACFEKLLTFFFVVHSHPNNCAGRVRRSGLEIPRALELTLYNRNRAAPGAYLQQFPHPLDADNCDGVRPLPLPAAWYRPGFAPGERA